MTTLFGAHLAGMPLTHLARTTHPARRVAPWHYWWQAHYLDCLHDEHERDAGTGALSEARKLARGIWLRHGGR